MASNPARWIRPGDSASGKGRRRRTGRQSGYSLLEVLIALAILALAVAMSIPSMSAMHERHQVRQAFAGLNAWILDQRTGARLAGAPARFEPGPLALPSGAMPRGWQAELLEPWRVFPSGACAPGRVRIHSPRQRIWERPLAVPQCRARLRVPPEGG
ncbi:prepilin-type N-terminal cleavage/methylation domain-containing protein [Maricaulis sp.]|uniref:prepilin-type N-terminal cleavage/methylation domain-containing protein n=1 Tax=Maricaulis sp. TaxID=1486257 RepID=UPI0026179C8C|nr:prepilin-type N-terminal cleavage/methylation domain-containing protein [Maricaulis sp.]